GRRSPVRGDGRRGAQAGLRSGSAGPGRRAAAAGTGGIPRLHPARIGALGEGGQGRPDHRGVDMNIAVLDDYADLVRTLQCYSKVAGHEVTIWRDHSKDPDTLAARLKDAEALVLLRERTPIPGALVERLPRLRMISQNGPGPHIDVAACTKRG